jgi:hypothetical protein
MDSLPLASTPEISLTPGDTNPSDQSTPPLPLGEAQEPATASEDADEPDVPAIVAIDQQLTTWLPPRMRRRRPAPPRLSYADLGYVSYGPSDSGGDHYALSGVYNATVVDAAPPTWGSWFRQEGHVVRTAAYRLWDWLGTYQLEALGILFFIVFFTMVATVMWVVTQAIALWFSLPG